jgi:integrase
MAKKNQRTTCSALDWNDFLFLVDALKRKEQFTTLMIIATGVYLGLRISDIRQLKWKQLIDADQFEIQEKKTGKSRFITLNQGYKDLIQYIRSKSVISGNDFIACNRRKEPLSIQYINRQLHKTFAENNINAGQGSSHTFRKTFGKRFWLLNNKSESSLILLSKVYNHSSIAVTRQYLGITSTEISEVYLSL